VLWIDVIWESFSNTILSMPSITDLITLSKSGFLVCFSESLKQTVRQSIQCLNLRIGDIENEIETAVLMAKDPSKSEDRLSSK
jgi:hypothetical protein